MGSVSEREAVMRDGTVLRADVYRPTAGEGADGGPWPVLLARTPYGKEDPGVLARLNPVRAAGRGYLVVIQDCRGRFGSEGDWTPLAHEEGDGHDSVAWAAALPEADGRVMMYGPSYLGHVQWAATATRPPALCAVVPEFTWSDPYDGLITRGGAGETGLLTQWTLALGANVLERRYAQQPTRLRRQLAELSCAVDELASRTYRELPPGETIRRLDLPLPRPSRQAPAGCANAHVPALIVAGWYDSFLQGGLDAYAALRGRGTPVSLIIGPWSHDNQSSRIGETDFGATADAASIDHGRSLLDRELDWLDRRLHQDGVRPEEDVSVFVMGVNQWRRIPNWPPETTGATWFLHSGGRLSPEAPEAESQPDTFRNDPGDPVPTHGGGLLLTPEHPAGPYDQRQVEKREDVLVYTSAPLQSPVEVVGRIRLHLAGASTAPVTDWVARLCDVDADGVSRNITDGILRTSTSTSEGEDTRSNEAEHEIDLWSTAHVFLPGHRIRLQVTASCFPRWDVGSEAQQTVHHDTDRPSRLVLPVSTL